MKIRLPSKVRILRVAKIIGGALSALVVFMSGGYGCPPNLICVWYPDYVPILDIWSFGSALLAIALLLSALKEIVRSLKTTEVLSSDIEAVASLNVGNPFSDA